jgi:mono/diheme cytochrome c family protein
MAVHHSHLRSTVRLVLLAAAFGVTMTSCESSYDRDRMAAGDPVAAGDPSPPSTGAQQGRQLFQTAGCAGCHTVNGQGGKVGPDLSNEGNAGRSPAWLTAQIRDPKSHNPQTIMPAFDKLSDQQVNDLVDYLKSLQEGRARAGPTAAAPVRGATAEPTAPAGAASLVTTGGQMWSQTCGQCHNLRPPSEYSDAQWAVAIDHMRVRVPLTGQEQRNILAFLQASN